jgi:hypothetical protein
MRWPKTLRTESDDIPPLARVGHSENPENLDTPTLLGSSADCGCHVLPRCVLSLPSLPVSSPMAKWKG